MKFKVESTTDYNSCYVSQQIVWRNAYNIKEGDTVRVVRWTEFDTTGVACTLKEIMGDEFVIENLCYNGVELHGVPVLVPYDMLEKVNSNSFEPLTLEITIESEDELRELWHRFNIERSVFTSTNYVDPPMCGHYTPVWKQIDSVCASRGLKKL